MAGGWWWLVVAGGGWWLLVMAQITLGSTAGEKNAEALASLPNKLLTLLTLQCSISNEQYLNTEALA